MKNFSKAVVLLSLIATMGLVSCTEQSLNDDEELQGMHQIDKEKAQVPTGG